MPAIEPPDPSELEEIFASIDPTPVRMAHDYLNEAGIESFVFDAGSSRLLGTTAARPTPLRVHGNGGKAPRSRLDDLASTEKGPKKTQSRSGGSAGFFIRSTR